MHQWMKLLGLCLLSICGAAHSAEVFVTYYHNDLLGSPVAATDESGKVLWREHFRPYGERQDTPAYRGYGSIGFTGHLQSQSNELVYMGARYYDPVIGRFLSVDPFGVDARKPKTLNRYIYAVGNPYAYIDPDGRQIVSVDAKDNGRIASWINNYASVRFGFNGNNQLQYIGGKNNSGSGYYSDRIKKAINNEGVIYIRVGERYFDGGTLKDEDISMQGGAVTSGLSGDSSTMFVTVSASEDNSAAALEGGGWTGYDPSEALMHELVGHAIPHMVGADTGNAISNENKALKQIKGLAPRLANPNHVE